MLTGRIVARVALLAVCTACVGSTRDASSPPAVESSAALSPSPPDEPIAPSESIETPAAPQPIAPPTRAVVTGVVRRSADDERVAGQLVSLVDDAGVARDVVTDARGAFEFVGVATGRPLELRASADGCAAVRVPSLVLDADEWLDVGTVRLGPPVAVVVRVRTWADEPVVGATVEAFRRVVDDEVRSRYGHLTDRRERSPAVVARTTTDAAGDATFSDAAAGAWTFVAGAARFATEGRTVRIGPRAPTALTIRLEPGSTFEARVLDADGGPVVGATVDLGRYNSVDPWRPFRATTDVDGRVGFDGVASGDHALFVRPRGAPTVRVARASVPEIRRLDVRLPRPAVARGVVVDVDSGLPVADAHVEIGEVATTTDADGRYEIAVLTRPGEFFGVRAEKEGYGVPKDEQDRRTGGSLRPGDVVTRDLRLRRGAPLDFFPVFRGLSPQRAPDGGVAGVVVDADGAPVAGANIRVDDEGAAVSDSVGEFRFDDVRPWKHVVEASTSDRHGAVEVVVESGRRAAATVRLASRDVVVRGHAHRTGGGALPSGTRVQLVWSLEGGRGMQWTAQVPVALDGAFLISMPSDAKRFSVRAQPPGLAAFFWDAEPYVPHPSDSPWIDVVAGKTAYEQDVELATGCSLSGRVVARDTGEPVAGAWILARYCCILGSCANPVRATTDADGRFRIDGVSKFRWPVGVEAPGFVTTAVWMDSGATSSSTTIALERETFIQGTVRFADGRPAEGVAVRALLPDCVPLNPSAREDRMIGVVDSAGRFRIAELPPGRFTIEARPRWNHDPWVLPKKLLDVATGSTDVEVVVERAK